MDKLVNREFNKLNGSIEIPADKSISHRAGMFSALAKGTSVIKNFSNGEDPHSTLRIIKQLGIDVEYKDNNEIIITSNGKFSSPTEALYCGNSGTTMRLMSGILAGQNFKSILTGDESLSSRPMKRVIEPLTLMGAEIFSKDNKAPLEIYGKNLSAVNYSSKIASAQVKSCVLLAGLFAEGKTTVTEPFLSRNHTEIMLKYMGADIETNDNSISISKSDLKPININICGDISSAAYFIAAALVVPNSDIILKNIGLNPTRCGIIEVLQNMGADVKILDLHKECEELVGDVQVKYSELKGCNISEAVIPTLIDEIPILAVLATQASGITKISDAQDLRNKESDRITCVVNELKKLGANIEETPDGMIIQGKTKLKGNCEINTYHDHRIAMSFYVAGLICEKDIVIKDFEWVAVSFPNFEELFEIIKK